MSVETCQECCWISTGDDEESSRAGVSAHSSILQSRLLVPPPGSFPNGVDVGKEKEIRNHKCKFYTQVLWLCFELNAPLTLKTFINIYFIIINYYLFILAVLGLCCYTWVFSSCGGQGLLLVAVRRLLIVVASVCWAWALGSLASEVVVHRLSCSVACGIFLEQGLNLCPLHWQEDF